MLKKMVSALLTVVLLVGAFPLGSAAEATEQEPQEPMLTIEFTQPADAAIRPGEYTTCMMSVKWGGELIPEEELGRPDSTVLTERSAKGSVKYYTVQHVSGEITMQNPARVRYIALTGSGRGTLRMKLEAGAITYKGESSPEVYSPVVYVDKYGPSMWLKGDKPQLIERGSPYVEMGVTVRDDYDPALQGDDIPEGRLTINTSAVDTSRAGTYSVKYRVTDWAGNVSVCYRAVVVADKTPVSILTAPAAVNLYYSGEEQELIIPGTAEGGKIVYSLSQEGPYTEEVPTASAVGEYTVWYKALGDTLHNDLEPVSIPVTLQQAYVPSEVPEDTDLPEGSTLDDVRLPEGWGWTDPTQSLHVGKNTALAVYYDKDNYIYPTKLVTITVTDASHTHSLLQHFPQSAACTSAGSLGYWMCSDCKAVFADAEGTTRTTVRDRATEPLGHLFEDNWHWSDVPDCTEPGEEFRECLRCSYVETKVVPANGHRLNRTAPTCTEAVVCETFHCETVLAPAFGHIYGEWEVTREPTCAVAGEERSLCAFCEKYICRDIPVVDHVFGRWVQTKAPTAEAAGEKRRECSHCGAAETAEIPIHEHRQVIEPEMAPTCTEEGLTAETSCSVCGAVLVKAEVIPALGHSYGEWTQAEAPACTTPGRKEHTCSRCGHVEEEEIPAAWHDPGPDYKLWRWEILRYPTKEKPGIKALYCAVCGDGVFGYFEIPYEEPAATPTPTATPTSTPTPTPTPTTAPTSEPTPPSPPSPPSPPEPTAAPTPSNVKFVDVPADAYYGPAVDWAVRHGITAGTTATTFSPNSGCTRAQAVTFLWRSAGKPEPKRNISFTDVKPGSYYEKAVKWAVENGITSGTGQGRFSPDSPCTRAQIVTLLWRAEGKPLAQGTDAFTDVKPGAYYETAVKWAVQHGVTSGTGGSAFSPENSCTRAQIVTFLWRNEFGLVGE